MQPSCMRTHTSSMRTHTRPNPNPKIEIQKNRAELKNYKSNNLTPFKTKNY